MEELFYCYMIYTTDNRHTYIGASTNPFRRLRQHNQELTGGAKATAIQQKKGLSWLLGCYLSNIPEWRSALQIEWRWKQLGRTACKHVKDPIDRRLYSLKKLLSFDKPTANSVPYDAYPNGPPVIVWENKEFEKRYDAMILSV
jgi:predicted GIY-YIG superfamily endonuclease